MKKYLLVLIIVILTMMTACGGGEDKQTSANTSPDNKNSQQFVQAFGRVKTTEIKDISLGFPIKLGKISIKNGQMVKNGDVLIQINKEDYDAAVDNKQHELNIINKDLSTPVGIKNEKKAICEKELQVLKSKANVSYIKQNQIVSDINNGIVYDLSNNQGDTIEAGKKILSIANADTMVVLADVVEEFIKDIKIGSDVTIIPSANKEKTYTGKVLSISNKAFTGSNGETTIPVEISITDKDDFLKPEFNVEVKINK